MLFLYALYIQVKVITKVINREEKQAIPTNRKVKHYNTKGKNLLNYTKPEVSTRLNIM